VIDSLSLEAGVLTNEPSPSHQPIVYETGVPSGSGGGSKVSELAAYSADGCLIRVYSKTAFSSVRAWSIWSYA
jgi:hypothetical protein